ncbi:protein-tyrosine phosphatase-like protein [Boletus edulis BED1]|uniref:Protein-tyrosine phosphatase-like protein n=1 Tax=Boletus edulis BED1 TaxID=1328754 RepID=A0AAD4GAB4_BOLED|nr:protein-tyrosine phosphatase-like protein [Boletus edulis BED1]
MTSTTIPPWLIQAREVPYQREISAELSKREKERSSYRNAPPTNTNTITSPLRKLLPGKSAPSQPEKSDHSKHYSVAIGRDPTNRWGNRYSNIEPYDRTRVVVGTSETACLGCGEGKGRYFNGSWVKELHGQKLWIATQAPLRDTAHAFLSVLSQHVGTSSDTSLPQGSRVRTVVQLTLNFEKGRIKAYPYYPFTVGESMTIMPEPGFDARPFVVTLEEQTTIEEANCMRSKLSVVPQGENTTASFTFTHMLYIAWPDHGIPQEEDQASLLKFVRLVDQVNKGSPAGVSDGSDHPIMVNCSAGVGRTGTFIAMSSLLRFYNLLDKKSPTPFDPSRPTPTTPSLLGPLSQPDPVAQEIDALREQRPEMVQRSEQVAVIYQILEQAFMDK